MTEVDKTYNFQSIDVSVYKTIYVSDLVDGSRTKKKKKKKKEKKKKRTIPSTDRYR